MKDEEQKIAEFIALAWDGDESWNKMCDAWIESVRHDYELMEKYEKEGFFDNDDEINCDNIMAFAVMTDDKAVEGE